MVRFPKVPGSQQLRHWNSQVTTNLPYELFLDFAVPGYGATRASFEISINGVFGAFANKDAAV